MLWQYRTILFEFTKDGLLGDKYVDDEEMEKTLNELGGQSWELINVALLQDGLLAFLKRAVPRSEAHVLEEQELEQEEELIEPVMIQTRPAPVPRSTPVPSRVKVEVKEEQEEQEEQEEPELIRIFERKRKDNGRRDDNDFIGGIRIS